MGELVSGHPAKNDAGGSWGPLRWPAELVATGLGLGLAPIAPATVASAAAVAVYWALPFGGDSYWFHGLTGATCLVGAWAADFVERTAGQEDPGRVVSDELAGMWVACLFLPKTWVWLLAAFLLFRALDIFKPLGIRRFEKLPGGIGIMADDMAAGLAAAGLLNLVRLAWFN